MTCQEMWYTAGSCRELIPASRRLLHITTLGTKSNVKGTDLSHLASLAHVSFHKTVAMDTKSVPAADRGQAACDRRHWSQSQPLLPVRL